MKNLLRVLLLTALSQACGTPANNDSVGKQNRYQFLIAPDAASFGRSFGYGASVATGGAKLWLKPTPVRLDAEGCGQPVDRDAQPFTRIESSQPSVLSVTARAAGEATLQSGTAGVATLRLLNAQGQEVDSFDVTVTPPSEIRFTDSQPTLVLAGGLARECVLALAGGVPVASWGALAIGFSGAIAEVSAPADSAATCDDFASPDHAVWFSGSAPGSGVLSVTAPAGTPSARGMHAWEVVSPSAITSVEIQSSLEASEPSGCVYRLVATAARSGTVVSGPRCEWQTSSGAAQITPQPHVRPRPDADEISVTVPRGGTYGVSCAIGFATQTLSLPCQTSVAGSR